MQFWSKGLGKRSLNIACGSERVEVKDGKVLLHGTTLPPLSWSYTITMDSEDWLGFFDVALHPTVFGFLLRPRRFRLALRAGWHLAGFLGAHLFALAGIRGRTAPPPGTPNAPVTSR